MMFIRTCGERDLAAIRTLLVETWHATYDGLYGAERVDAITAKWHSPQALRANLERDRSEFLVADDGAAISGVAYAAALGDDARIVMLHLLYVTPALQGKGVGGMLLGEIEGSFFESEMIRVDVEEKNARPVAFFEAEGYRRIGRREAGGSPPVIILSLEKSLLANA